MQPCWGLLFASCLLALLVCDRLAPGVLLAPSLTAPDAVRSMSYRPEVPSGDRWSGVSDAIHHRSIGGRRTLDADIAPAPGRISLPPLPTLLLRHTRAGHARDVTYQHERFYIHPRAPTRTAPATT